MSRQPQEWVVCRSMPEIDAVGQSLCADSEKDSFDLGCDWYRLLTDHGLPEGSEPLYGMLRDTGEVNAVLPLQRRVGELASLTTYYTSLYRPVLRQGVSSADLAKGFAALLREFPASSIRLDALDAQHPSFEQTLAALRFAGLKAFSYFDFGNWYLPTAGLDSESYFAGLPSRVRNTVKRREKKFLSKLNGSIQVLQQESSVDQVIDAWTRIYGVSWKKPEPFPEFVPELIRLTARRGWLRFGLAEIDGVPIAAQIWIVNGGRAAIYKLAYDEAYKSLSAGTILTAHLMRQVIDVDKVDEVDYLVGDDAYKKDWMTHRRERVGIIAYNPRTIRGLAGIAHQTLSQWRKRFHSKP